MITKKFIQSVRKLKPWTPAEKSRSSYIPPHAFTIFNHSSTQNWKKKLLNMIANVVGFEIILP